jgi:hypothetical protein
MPPLKKVRQEQKQEKTTEEQRIQFAVNSSSYCMIPHPDAEYVTVRNPVTGLDHHLKTDSEAFLAMVWELSQKGMKNKFFKDLQSFAELFDSKWANVSDLVRGYLKAKEIQSVD